MRIAIVYDRVNKWGGAERVLLALHEIFPDAPLYTSVYSKKNAPWADVFPKVTPSFLDKLPFLKVHHELLGVLTPIAFEQFDFDKYDLVISVTSEASKGIITKPGTIHICYCLTPTRYLWSGYKDYLNNLPKKLKWIPFYGIISKPILGYVKYWDKLASSRPDQYIAISNAVKDRIKKYYYRDSDVIYPPVDTEKIIDQISKIKMKKQNREKYFLVVSRLVPYKKVDLVIRAFNKLNEKLVIVGIGSEERYLKRIAGENIEFKGFVNDSDLVSIYQNAKALIHPQDEDFGITPVEAQAAGVPVIAYRSGGALDTVIEGETGLLFDYQDEEALTKAITKFQKMRFDIDLLKSNANRFNISRFKKEILDLISFNS